MLYSFSIFSERKNKHFSFLSQPLRRWLWCSCSLSRLYPCSLSYPFSFPLFLISLFFHRLILLFLQIHTDFHLKKKFFTWLFCLLQLIQRSCLSGFWIIKIWPNLIQFSLTFLIILNMQSGLTFLLPFFPLIHFYCTVGNHLPFFLKLSAFESYITFHWFPSQFLVCFFSSSLAPYMSPYTINFLTRIPLPYPLQTPQNLLPFL